MLNVDLPNSVENEFSEFFDYVKYDLVPATANQYRLNDEELAEEIGVLLIRLGLALALMAETMESDSLQIAAEKFVIEQKFECP